jgi:hypothetical protein
MLESRKIVNLFTKEKTEISNMFGKDTKIWSRERCDFAGEATWGGEKSRQAEQDEYDGSEFMGGGGGGVQGAQCKQM